jgi:hypothetical protein
MNSNELREYIRELNKQEQVQTEIRRQKALARIRELREQLKYNNNEKVNG